MVAMLQPLLQLVLLSCTKSNKKRCLKLSLGIDYLRINLFLFIDLTYSKMIKSNGSKEISAIDGVCRTVRQSHTQGLAPEILQLLHEYGLLFLPLFLPSLVFSQYLFCFSIEHFVVIFGFCYFPPSYTTFFFGLSILLFFLQFGHLRFLFCFGQFLTWLFLD